MAVVAAVLVVALLMMIVERVLPGRNWPRVPGWWIRALLLNSLQVTSVLVGGMTWERWMPKSHLLAVGGLNAVSGALVGYLTITFVFYWWHRWRHESAFLWTWFHQVHHSPQRIEVITSFYKHPFEILANGLICSTVLYPVLGLGSAAASGAVALSGLAELVYHWNVTTPHWLGYLFQRPESHCLHHQEGVHSYNYSDLPLWDILFGTFQNPRHWRARCGFGMDEARLVEMLGGLVVSDSGVQEAV
ncbi:MAG TPA: sterol desaturase family protein [Vicinamibacteria bacterium]|nr:sterol desaturase family protein [Vicinamibacteria bacterium]